MSEIVLNFESSHTFEIDKIALEFAKLNSDQQSLFFKLFFSHLRYSCRDKRDDKPSKFYYERQLDFIAKEFDEETRDAFECIYISTKGQ